VTIAVEASRHDREFAAVSAEITLDRRYISHESSPGIAAKSKRYAAMRKIRRRRSSPTRQESAIVP
jgi:hypothetical protein